MKICLINVPNTYELVGNDPVIIKDQQGIYPPLGILYIAACMQQAGYEVSVIDAQAEDLNHVQVAQRVHELKPDVVGLTAMTFTLVDVKLTVQEIRKRLKTIIIIGGPHTAIYPDECFEKEGLNADYVIVGEGEKTLVRLCQDIEMGKAKDRIYRQLSFIEDLNELPFPARELTLVDKYYSVLSEDTPTTTAFSSRGCPFSCFTGETLILTSDLKWKRIDSVEKGQGIIGVYDPPDKSRTEFKEGFITHVFPLHEEEVFKITTNKGFIQATGDHKFLTTHKRWRTTKQLKSLLDNQKLDQKYKGATIRWISPANELIQETDDYKKGYICGAIKSDGHFKAYPNGSHITNCIGDPEMMDFVLKYAQELGLGMKQCKFNGGMYKKLTRQIKSNKRADFETVKSWYLMSSPDFKRGYLAGYYDGDGSYTSCIRFHSVSTDELKHLQSLLAEQGFVVKLSKHREARGNYKANWIITFQGGTPEELRFISWCQPKVFRKHRYWNAGIKVYNRADVLSIEPIGKRLVYNLSTSLGNYIANGLVVSNCSYCDRPALGKGFRAMSATRVADEMAWCQEHGIKEIFFYDDTFSVSMKRVMEICAEIKRRNIKIKWDVRTRVNVVNDDLIKNMKEAGCERIHFGVETGNPRVVKELQKGTSIEQVEKAFDLCKKYNVKTLAYFMMGNPTETMEDVKDTLALSRRIKPDFMQMTILSPFPATQIYLRALQEGVIEGDPWRDYARRINDDFRPPLWDQIFTRTELEKNLRWFYGQFYLQPSFVFDRIKEVRNFGQFKRYASAGISLLKMTMIPESKITDSWQTRTKTGIAASAKPETAVTIS